MDHMAKLPVCPKCGGLPGFYTYYEDKQGNSRIHNLLCSQCRTGPVLLVSVDPIKEWINWATPKKSKI